MTGNSSGADPPRKVKALSLRITPEDECYPKGDLGSSDLQRVYQQCDSLGL